MPALKSIQDIDWNTTLDRQFTPSPQSWSDQVMYFLLVDRFSDGNEKSESVFTTDKAGLAIPTENDAER